MSTNSGFRCPFEVQGEAAGTIVTVHLDDSRESRMAAYKESFERFSSNLDLVGLRFVLPQHLLQGLKTIEGLRPILLPYQCELLAAEIDQRLYPFLPYQPYRTRMVNGTIAGTDRAYLEIAYNLVEAITRSTFGPVESATDILEWILPILEEAYAGGQLNASIVILDPNLGLEFPLLKIIPGSLVIEFERLAEPTNPGINRNLFSIVKCPFYPREFGRFSEQVEIIFSREAHFASMPTETRRRIRTGSNLILANAGIPILDIAEDKQKSGLWIP